MFEFTMIFETINVKSPMTWLAFPREAKVNCRITFLFKFDKNLQIKLKIASNSCKLNSIFNINIHEMRLITNFLNIFFDLKNKKLC